MLNICYVFRPLTFIRCCSWTVSYLHWPIFTLDILCNGFLLWRVHHLPTFFIEILPREGVTIRGGLDWILSTSTHDSWLHLIIAPSLISTLYKSIQHTLSYLVFCVFTSRFLATASNSGDSSASTLKCTDSLTTLTNSASESESELLYDWRFTANQFVMATNPLRPTTSIFVFQGNACGYSPYVTFSLTIGWVCRLQLLLVHASAVVLGAESRGTPDHILLPQIRDSPNLEGQVPLFMCPSDRVAQLYPRHWVPFSSPPTTHRVTVEVFDPASTSR
jgi:hypothetical protein